MIIAVDFDGVIVSDAFPEIGSPDYTILSLLNKVKNQGHEVILWTCRVEERLWEAVAWCKERRLKFTVVNGNSPENLALYRTDPRKVYADVYIDDRAIGYSREAAIEFLESLIPPRIKEV